MFDAMLLKYVWIVLCTRDRLTVVTVEYTAINHIAINEQSCRHTMCRCIKLSWSFLLHTKKSVNQLFTMHFSKFQTFYCLSVLYNCMLRESFTLATSNVCRSHASGAKVKQYNCS